MRNNLSFLTVLRVDRFYRVTDIGACAEHAYKRENLVADALGSVHLTHTIPDFLNPLLLCTILAFVVPVSPSFSLEVTKN